MAYACDMICWGRPHIADPELPRKAQEGRVEAIIPCIACNQGYYRGGCKSSEKDYGGCPGRI